jgi:hypothetical protein
MQGPKHGLTARAVRVHDRRDGLGVCCSNVSLVPADPIPADVPLAFSNKIGFIAGKCNKEKVAEAKILRDKGGFWPAALLLHKQREGGSEAVEETFLADGTNLAVAEKAGHA